MKSSLLHSARRVLSLSVLVGGLVSGTASAQYGGPRVAQTQQSGYVGSVQVLTVTTVKQLLDTGRDDQVALLRGRIVSWQGGKHYTFDDGTGQIRVEIKPLRFPREQKIDETTEVELIGELERDRKGVSFEVERVSVRR